MCRMTFISTVGYRPSAWRLVKFAMRQWGSSNDDGTGIAWAGKHGTIFTVKDALDATKFFKTAAFLPKGDKILGHCRAATHGNNTRDNTHPFRSCDGKSVFAHNGIIYGYGSYKAELIAKGHKFQSETDSEVIMHALEEVGPEKVMEELKSKGVSGNANWIWFQPDVTYGFSDGSLHLVQNEKGLKVGLFSDLAPFGKKFFSKAKSLKGGTLVTIRGGSVETKAVGTIFGVPANDDVGYANWQGGGRWTYIRGYGSNNVTTDREWAASLWQDSPKESALEAELALDWHKDDDAKPPVGLNKLFEQNRRIPVVTIGKNVSESDRKYATAMQMMLRDQNRRDALEERRQREREPEEIEIDEDLSLDVLDAPLEGFYCRKCDKTLDKPNGQGRCPYCYSELFDIAENYYME